MRLLDSSVLISIGRGRLPASTIWETDEEVALSALTVSECLHGLHRAIEARHRAERAAWIEVLLEHIPVLSVDLGVARLHAALRADLQRTGVTLGAHDLLIGATAMAHQAAVMTRDLRSFPRIPGLQVISC